MNAHNTSSRLLKARRLMVIGLVISVLGNRVIDGALDGMTAAGVVSVGVLVVISSLGQISVFSFPLYARFLKKKSPDLALIAVDIIEALLSAIAMMVSVIYPEQATNAVIAFVVIDLFLSPISDIADEFYGAKLAEAGEDEALAFNASLYSLLGLLGLVIASPLGAVLSGFSVSVLLFSNIILSLFGAAFRSVARRSAPVGPLQNIDDDEYSAMGERIALKQFIRDMFRSGPASPLLSLILQVIGALTGQLLFLWVAGLNSQDPHYSMALVLSTFGIGATVGPILGRWLRRRWSTKVVLRVTAFASLCNVLVLLVSILLHHSGFISGLLFVLVNVSLNKARVVVLETHRQVFFKGSQFARIMSWSYSFGAVGTILGLQIGFWLNLVSNPVAPLCIAVVLWIVVAIVVTSSHGVEVRSN